MAKLVRNAVLIGIVAAIGDALGLSVVGMMIGAAIGLALLDGGSEEEARR